MRNRFQFSLLFLLVANLFATTLTVKTDGSGDYTSIQAAINASSNGDIVLVYAGTYTENIDFNGKNIVVGSLYLTTGTASYISSTIIDGNENGRVIEFENGETSAAVLKGFTITNNVTSSFGGGVWIGNGSDPTLTNLIISGNQAFEAGGVYIGGAGTNPTLSNIIISNNNLCEEYHDCIDYYYVGHWGTQDQSNCCEGPNGEPDWTTCP